MRKIYILVSLLLITALIIFKLFSNRAVAEKEIRAEQAAIPFAVEATKVQLKRFSILFTYSGLLEAVETANVLTEVDGKIDYIPIEKGNFVHKGQLLARLHNSRVSQKYQIDLLAYEKAKLDFDRIKILHAENNATGSELESATLALGTAEKMLQISRAEMSYLTINAPINGIVASKQANTGDVMAVNSPVSTIIALQNVEIRVMVPEKDIANIHKGAFVIFSVDAYPGKEFRGSIAAIIPTGNDAHMFPVIIRAGNNQHDVILMPGMSCKASFNQSQFTSALVVPRLALHGTNDQTYVWVIGSDNKAVRRVISIGREFDDYVAVNYGLKAGDIVVTKGFTNITDSLKIDSFKMAADSVNAINY